jgi:hypothetical protein
VNRTVVIGGFAALVALDLVLVTVALRPGSRATTTAAAPAGAQAAARPDDATPPPGVTRSRTPSVPAGAGTSTAASNLSTPPDGGRVVLLDALTSKTAARASTSTRCAGGPATLHLTHDGGVSWQAAKAPGRYIQRVHLTGESAAWAIAAGTDCKPAMFTTKDAGMTWARAAGLSAAWYVVPSGAAAVHAPGGEASKPCPADAAPGGLSAASRTWALVVCAAASGAGRARVTRDGGATWAPVGDTALDVTAGWVGPDGRLAVVAADERCPGVSVRAGRLDGGTWAVGDCLPTKAPAAVVWVNPQRGVFATDSATFTTADGGRTWAPAS